MLHPSCKHNQAAASWEEIGKALGCSPNAAYMTFCNAIEKLRARPERFKRFRELVAEKNRIRRATRAL